MAKQDIIISIRLQGAEGASKSTDQLSKATKKLSDLQRQEAIELEKVNQQIKIQKELNVAAAKSSLGLAQSTKSTSEAFKASKTQAGLNNAILLESGRLASDASYGFTAMANNLSQLVSLFGSFVKTAGGIGASFRQLGKSLLGTGGVLLGVQLLIGALQSPRFREFITELNGISRAMRLLKESTEEATDVFGKQIGFLRTMETLLNDTTVSNRQKEIILKRVKKEHEDLNPLLDEEGKLTKESTSALEDYLVLLERKARSQSLLNAIEEEYVKLQLLQDSATSDNVSIVEVLIDKFKALAKGQSALSVTSDLVVKGEENKQEEINKTKDTISELTEELKKLGIFMDKDRKSGYGRREREFRQHLLDLNRLEESYRQRAVDTQMMTAEEIIDEEEKNAKAELKIRVDSFKAKQKLRLDEFLETTKDADKRKRANDEYNESIRLADEESRQVTIELENSFNTKRTQLIRKRREEDAKEQERADDILKQYLDGRIETQKTFEEESNELYYNANENRIQQDMDFIAKRIELETDDVALRAELQTQFYALQDELRQNDLEREISSIEAKKNVNMEYVGFAEQTGSLLEKLGNRSKALANVALAVEKGAAIAKVIVSAQASIAAKTASANAIPAFLPPFGTPNPSFLVAQAEAKASNTRTKISAALSIANILASLIGKKGAPKDTSGGGGGKGSVQIQAPDFNIVGASQTSQLAQAVTEQQAKPVKAFVVGKDISTQQELDRNITNTASFG